MHGTNLVPKTGTKPADITTKRFRINMTPAQLKAAVLKAYPRVANFKFMKGQANADILIPLPDELSPAMFGRTVKKAKLYIVPTEVSVMYHKEQNMVEFWIVLFYQVYIFTCCPVHLSCAHFLNSGQKMHKLSKSCYGFLLMGSDIPDQIKWDVFPLHVHLIEITCLCIIVSIH